MGGKTDFTEDEWKNLQQGVTGAGMLVSTAHRDFTDSFGEASAIAKQLAAHRESESQLVRELSGTHGTGFGLVASPNEVAEGTMRLNQIAVVVATTLCAGYGCSSGPDTKGDVRKALDQANMPRVEVKVDTDEHIVHLQGVVGSMAERSRAQEVADAVVGPEAHAARRLAAAAVRQIRARRMRHREHGFERVLELADDPRPRMLEQRAAGVRVVRGTDPREGGIVPILVVIDPLPGPIRIVPQRVPDFDDRLERGQRQHVVRHGHGRDRPG